jgi:hypothetical protein
MSFPLGMYIRPQKSSYPTHQKMKIVVQTGFFLRDVLRLKNPSFLLHASGDHIL